MAFALQSRSVSAARTSVQAPKPSIRTVMPLRARSLITRASTDKAAVLADVQAIIAEQLGKQVSEVSAESKFVDLGADSLDTVEIMMALEEKFEITLDEEGAEKISTVQEAADLISSQVSGK